MSMMNNEPAQLHEIVGALRSQLEREQEENTRLRAEVARLPTAKDGYFVLPGVTLGALRRMVK